jgi:Uma2 family endonuclease
MSPMKAVRPRVSYADLERAPEDGRRYETDRGKKMQMFARYGVPEYWIVDPAAETIEVYELRSAAYELALTANGDSTVTPASLPGHSFPAGSLFPQR